jgi:hypothetical protein
LILYEQNIKKSQKGKILMKPNLIYSYLNKTDETKDNIVFVSGPEVSFVFVDINETKTRSGRVTHEAIITLQQTTQQGESETVVLLSFLEILVSE